MRIREVKRNLNKPDQVFVCYLLHRWPGALVLVYVTDRAYPAGPVPIARGSITLAFYWSNRMYILWRMLRPDGVLLGHYVHLCDQLSIESGEVTYRDLLLDFWIGANGRTQVLDAEELQEAIAKKLLDQATVQRIRQTKEAILTDIPAILTEADKLLVEAAKPNQRMFS